MTKEEILEGYYTPEFDHVKEAILMAMEEYSNQKTQLKHMKSGIELIAEERQRQIDVEKWDYTHDADYKHGELIGAAACYAMEAANKGLTEPRFRAQIHRNAELDIFVNDGDRGDRQLKKAGWEDCWPWSPEWDKRKKHDKLKCLQIAGALIAAEIDRLQPA